MTILVLFVALQVCDLATTLLFLHQGASEANPLVAALINTSLHPAIGVLFAKLAACALATLAWKSDRTRLLRHANLFYIACIGWNLLAIVRI